MTGKKDDKKVMKVKTARDLWVPAINNTEQFGRWAVLEIQDIHETEGLIRGGMQRGFDNLTNN
jgi:type III restriction enzyme